MKAIAVEPKKPGTARYMDIPEPDLNKGSILVEAIAVGVCGTNLEGKYGWAPPGQNHLILGHESLGRVIDPGPGGGFMLSGFIGLFTGAIVMSLGYKLYIGWEDDGTKASQAQ